MERWNVGIMVEKRLSEDKISFFEIHHSIIPIPRELDVGSVRFLADRNPYPKDRPLIDLTFHGDLTVMV